MSEQSPSPVDRVERALVDIEVEVGHHADDDCGKTVKGYVDAARAALPELRRLEEERDEALAEAKEEARLNGMGAEREARLQARISELEATIARLERDLRHMAEDAGGDSCADYAVRNATLRARLERAEGAINWAMGCKGRFRFRRHGEGRYWWRSELAERAGLTYSAEHEEYRAALAPEDASKGES